MLCVQLRPAHDELSRQGSISQETVPEQSFVPLAHLCRDLLRGKTPYAHLLRLLTLGIHSFLCDNAP
jgi:hypothetical protein